METDREAEKGLKTGSPSNASILMHLASGEQEGMAMLYDRYSSLVYSIALRVLRDPSAAEDVLHEVLMQVWRAPDSFGRSASRLGARLALAARNRAVDVLHRRRGETGADEIAFPSGLNLANDTGGTVFAEKMRAILGQLPRYQSKALAMAFFDGLPADEIASITGDSPGSVKQHIRTALLAVRKAALT